MAYNDFGGSVGGSGGSETVIVDEIIQHGEEGFAKGPERALMAALLFDGLQAYMSYICAKSRGAKSKYKEAYNWVSSDDSEYVFSFGRVCE